jgi:hypothetical protein
MGDNNTGGGGSVQWQVISRQPIRHKSELDPEKLEKLTQTGADNGAQENHDNFTVTIRFPTRASYEQFREIANAASVQIGEVITVEFPLPIRADPKQIAIHWGTEAQSA